MIRKNPPGTYILIIRLSHRHTIEVGSLGKVTFEKGYYLYVGSGLAGLRSRLERHLRTKNHMHWHIDYLLQHGRIREIWYHLGPERYECAWADTVQRIPGVEPSRASFGASDCACQTHLFYSRTFPRFKAFKARIEEKVEIRKTSISVGDLTVDL
ncbi:MAG: GIY-YIG nuclease family protein [Anaerolineales bacterium]